VTNDRSVRTLVFPGDPLTSDNLITIIKTVVSQKYEQNNNVNWTANFTE